MELERSDEHHERSIILIILTRRFRVTRTLYPSAAHERYLQKHSKLLNLQLEIDRIEAKRDTSENGLSSGQENTILKNLTKLQTLQSDLDGIEKEIRDAVGAKEKRESGAKKFVSKESGFYDEEEVSEL